MSELLATFWAIVLWGLFWAAVAYVVFSALSDLGGAL